MPSFDHFCQQLVSDTMILPAFDALEKHQQLNRNLLLFCCWFAITGQGRLRQKDIRLLRKKIASWHNKVVLQLQQLSSLPESAVTQYHKTLSLAQQFEQRLLADTITHVENNKQKDEQKLKNMFRNIKLYFDYLHIPLKDSEWQAIYALLGHYFPTFSADKIYAWCKSNTISKYAATQLQMDFI